MTLIKPIETIDFLHQLESEYEQAKRRIKLRFDQSMTARTGFKKPNYGTALYYDLVKKGRISPEEMEADELLYIIRSERTGQKISSENKWSGLKPISALQGWTKSTPIRWAKEKPIPSDQYSPNMATTAARDQRITGNAKALLQVLHARCHQTGQTETTKGTLANIMGKCERTIQRYISELSKFGYILTETRKNTRGLYTGLIIKIDEKTKPFYEDLKRTADLMRKHLQENWEGKPYPNDSVEKNGSFLEETLLSLKKPIPLYNKKKDRLTPDFN